ncbi:MAG TPA: hypothetical protein VEH05_07585 [Streptosporangiaceae bacterium]|nr:hypothetical protein [Streptosporangiaceae bacterium]
MVADSISDLVLTPVEQSLIDYVTRGQWLKLGTDDETVDETTMRSWDDARSCSAVVIREILRGRYAANPDPHGVRLRRARIVGRLDLENLTTSVFLELRECFLEEGIVARDANMPGMALLGCRLEHPTEPPLDADRLTCTSLVLQDAAINGHSEGGAVSLTGAHAGLFACSGANLHNDSGPALDARSMHVDQLLILTGLTAVGAGRDGAVNLSGAHVSGQLDCSRASLRNDSGPALDANGIEVGQSLGLSDGFNAVGAGQDGAVNLIGAHVSGQLNCTRASLRNDSGPALEASLLRVDQDLFLHDGFSAVGGGDGVAVDLTGVKVGGFFGLELAGPVRFMPRDRRIAVDGLAYAGVPSRVSPEEWLQLLRYGTNDYAAQPYQQLAAGYRALGDDRRVRQILISQRDDQLARTHARLPERLWGKITKVSLGYGYEPWRALLFLVSVVVLSCSLAVALGSHGALTQTANTSTPGRSCTFLQQVSVGLDLNLPVGTSLSREGCGLARDSTSVTAAWLAGADWMLQLLAWAFAALFLAGFTSAVRRT